MKKLNKWEKALGKVYDLLCSLENDLGDKITKEETKMQLNNIDPDNMCLLLKETNPKFFEKKDIVENYNDEVKKCKTKEEQAIVGNKYFYYYRDNDFQAPWDKATKFYLMRQLSFSGMLRFSSSGNFNVPYGRYKTLKVLKHDVEKVEKILNNTLILHGPWQQTIQSSTTNDFVFLDPPYTRKFQKYHPDGTFGERDHVELAKWFAMDKAKAMIIINKDDFTEGPYKPFIRKEYEKKYSIQYRNRMTEKDSNAVHILATNYR